MKIGKFLVVAICGGLLSACAPVAPPPPSLNCKNLPASAGDQARAVQQALAGLGYQVGALEQRMNSQTMEALRAFQRDMGLPASGQADAQTLAALGFCARTSSSVAMTGCQDFPVDRRGQSQAVQRLLAEQGYDPGTTDGHMGRKTVEALKRFQANNGLSRTGRIDEATREAMGFCGEPVGSKPASVPPPPPVSDPQLEEAQRLLAEHGYDPGQADGLMGKKTREALKRFQTENGLLVSGKADSQTLGVLRSAAAPKKTSLEPGKTNAGPSRVLQQEDLPSPPPTAVPPPPGHAGGLPPPPPTAVPPPSANPVGTLPSPPPPPPPVVPPAPPSNNFSGSAPPSPPTAAPQAASQPPTQTSASDTAKDRAVVYRCNSPVVIRAEKNMLSKEVVSAPSGTDVRLVADQGEWLSVEYQGKRGFIPSSYIGIWLDQK